MTTPNRDASETDEPRDAAEMPSADAFALGFFSHGPVGRVDALSDLVAARDAAWTARLAAVTAERDVYYREARDIEKRAQTYSDMIEGLRDLLHRDRTGLAAGLEAVVKRARAAGWIAEGRGSYEWDDDKYREETGWFVRDIIGIALKALEASGTLVNEGFHGATAPAVLPKESK